MWQQFFTLAVVHIFEQSFEMKCSVMSTTNTKLYPKPSLRLRLYTPRPLAERLIHMETILSSSDCLNSKGLPGLDFEKYVKYAKFTE